MASCDLPEKIKPSAVICINNSEGVSRYYFKRKNKVEFEVEFDSQKRLKRWVDLGTYSTYFGFNMGGYSCVIIAPEEKPKAVALLEVKRHGKTISTQRCEANSFGDKNIKSQSVEDLLDSNVRDNGFKFP